MILELQHLTTGERERGIGSVCYTPIFYEGIKIAHSKYNPIDGTGEANTISFIYDYREYPHDKSYSWLRYFYQRHISEWWDYRTVGELDQAIQCAINAGLPIVPFYKLSSAEKAIVTNEKGKS